MSKFVPLPSRAPRTVRDGWAETLLEFVERLAGESVSELDAKLLLALTPDRENWMYLLEYIKKLTGKFLSDLDVELIFMLAKNIAVSDRRKDADNVS